MSRVKRPQSKPVQGESVRNRSGALLDAALVVMVVVVALAVRYPDPLSSSVMPAEDPFTHLVFTKEHVDRGYFADSFHMDTSLYPPGMHAFIGIFWMLSGVDLYALMLYGAPLFGGLSAAGMYILGRRFAGVATGVTAGLLVAFIPEHAFRSNLFAPSAFDLALIPFVLLAFMSIADGHRAWLAPGILIALALLFAHPWVIPLTLVPVILYVLARKVLVHAEPEDARTHAAADAAPRTRAAAREGRTGSWRDTALAAGTSLVLVVAALRFRWKQSDTGFDDFAQSRDDALIMEAALAVLNPVTLAILAVGVALVWFLARKGRDFAARSVAALGIAGVLAIAIPTLTYSPPLYVDYAYQLGWLPIGLAVLGLVALPFTPANRLTLMGAAIAAVTFPLTAVNIFHSPFLPHRTVVYLTMGIALLGAGFVATLTAAVGRMDGRAALHRILHRPVGRVATALAVFALLGGALAGPGTASPDVWYRYYEDDEFRGFLFVRDRLQENPDAFAVSGDWRPNMVMKSFAPGLGHAVYSEGYYTDAGERARVNNAVSDPNAPVYIIVDKYTKQRFGQPTFVGEPGYEVAWESASGDLTVYRHGGSA